ncbi:MAG: DUF1501 domain-containing protein, partial [Planctomycetaceae bacterium]|nr:DUF1501 domain-containing protein [Planctomycetaceae bacterium]
MNQVDPTQTAIARRTFLKESALGLGSIALQSMMGLEARGDDSKGSHNGEVTEGHSNVNRGILRETHHPPRAKRVIFLFMAGGPSHVDLFDPKPLLNKLEGQKIPAELLKDHQAFALIRGMPELKGSPYQFKPHGESGTIISELMP